MRGKSLSDSQPVRRFLHFVIQHEILKKNIHPNSSMIISFTTFWRHLHPFFNVFFPATSGSVFFLVPRQVMSELNVISTEMKLDVLGAEEADAMDAEAAAEHTKKREEKVTRNLRRVHQGHRLNRRFLWRSGKKNTFELGRYFGKKKVGGSRFCVHFFWVLTPPRWQMDQQEGNF